MARISAYSARFSPFMMKVSPVHVDLDVAGVETHVAQFPDDEHGHAHVAHEDLHLRLAVFALQEQRHALLLGMCRGVGDPIE